MNRALILAIDQSTQGTKAMLLDETGVLLCRSDKKHRQLVSPQGWVEHDPEEIYQNTIGAVREVLQKSGVDPCRVVGAGISNQRETVLIWDKKNGHPIYNAIVWQCGRAATQCARLKEKAKLVQKLSGLPLSPYFSAAKAAWILERCKRTKEADLACGTIDSWLIWKLTGAHRTDYSNAARTQLFDVQRLCWSDELCEMFGVDKAMLPEVCDSDACFGKSDFSGTFLRPIPICGVLGDSNGALFGQGCFASGATKCTFGTGSSVMMNVGSQFPGVHEGIATSLAWKLGGQVNYVLEGNINYTGAIITWLCEDIGLITSPKECSALAAVANPDDGTYLVPAFSGLGAPYWNSGARACFWGMSRTTGKAELVKAAEQAIAFQIDAVVKSLEQASGRKLTDLRADGGPTRDGYLMQFQCNLLNVPLLASATEELSGAGAGFVAGQSLGLFNAAEAASQLGQKRFVPAMDAARRQELLCGWEQAVNAVCT
jgi:Glycerol kinase